MIRFNEGARAILNALDTFKSTPNVCSFISKTIYKCIAGDVQGAKKFSSNNVAKKLVSAISLNKDCSDCCIELCKTLWVSIAVDKTRENINRALGADALNVLMQIATGGSTDKQVGCACQVISDILLFSDKAIMSFVQKGFVQQIFSVYDKYKDNEYIAGYFSTIVYALSQTQNTPKELNCCGVIQILQDIIQRYRSNKHVVRYAYKALDLLGPLG